MNHKRPVLTATLKQIAYVLPEQVEDNSDLAREFPEWSVEKIFEKTGIRQRRIAAMGQLSSDLAVEAAEKLFKEHTIDRGAFDYLIFCTQSPDYFLPASACLIQDRLRLPKTCGAIDVNQGCSGYIYGLGLAKGLIESRQARNVLLLTGETYSKFIRRDDRSVRTLFGDAASATWLAATEADREMLHSFVYGTDGSGAQNLIVQGGALRARANESGTDSQPLALQMNGPEVLSFTLREVPRLTAQVLDRAGLSKEQISGFIFHQANRFMLEAVRRKISIPAEKFCHHYETCGNTVSATIPIALKEGLLSGRTTPSGHWLLAGFGVGYSWAGCILDAGVRPVPIE